MSASASQCWGASSPERRDEEAFQTLQDLQIQRVSMMPARISKVPKMLVCLNKCILTLSFRSLDPFQLIPCRSFGEEVQVSPCFTAPIKIHISSLFKFKVMFIAKLRIRRKKMYIWLTFYFLFFAVPQEPFQIVVCAETLLILDMVCLYIHAHTKECLFHRNFPHVIV